MAVRAVGWDTPPYSGTRTASDVLMDRCHGHLPLPINETSIATKLADVKRRHHHILIVETALQINPGRAK